MKVRMVGLDNAENEIKHQIVTQRDIFNECAVSNVVAKILDIRRMVPRSLFLDKMVKRPVFEDFNTLLDEIIDDFKHYLKNQETA